jgi:mersacidin/lichenicidin family type 2 lantibiotic
MAKNIVRAWRDAEYLAELTDDERALIPENPAGLVQLTDEALDNVVGGASCLCWSACVYFPELPDPPP